VLEADDFHCPAGLLSGWYALRQKVIDGDDLGPHLSQRHSTLTNLDGLLNEWGVCHFHLGTYWDPRNPGLVKRTGPLVFALVTDDDFYAINVHSHANWECSTIVESLHRNWPHVIASYQIRRIAPEALNAKERRNVRQLNAQAVVAVSDGTVYRAIGGGVMAAGNSLEALMYADQLSAEVKRLQSWLERVLEDPEVGELLAHLRAKGYCDGLDLKAKLVTLVPLGLTPPQEYCFAFPDHDVEVRLVKDCLSQPTGCRFEFVR
jgi:hypothetical protein